jgi:ATP-dependent Lon protease
MKGLLTKWLNHKNINERILDEEQWRLDADSLYALLANFFGTDKLVLKASKLNALSLIRSENLAERVLGLKKIINEDPIEYKIPSLEEIPGLLNEIEERTAEIIARRSVEERLGKVVAEKMQERHEDYLKEIKLQVLKESAGPENAHTLKKLAQ